MKSKLKCLLWITLFLSYMWSVTYVDTQIIDLSVNNWYWFPLAFTELVIGVALLLKVTHTVVSTKWDL